jgi:hypothetical protein
MVTRMCKAVPPVVWQVEAETLTETGVRVATDLHVHRVQVAESRATSLDCRLFDCPKLGGKLGCGRRFPEADERVQFLFAKGPVIRVRMSKFLDSNCVNPHPMGFGGQGGP